MAGLPLQHEASQQPLDDAAKAEAEKNEIEGKHISKTSRLLEGAAARLQDTGKGLIDSAVITDRLDKVSGQLASHLPHHSEDGDVEAGTAGPGAVLRGMQKKNAVTEEAFVASEYAGQPSPSVGGSESPKPFGAGVSSPDDDDDHFNLDQHASASTMHRSTSTSHVQEPTKSSYYSTGSFTPPATDSLQHELMLDIAGYKTQEQDDKEGDGLKTPPELSNAQVDLQERITEGKAKELHERDPDVFALTRALLRYSESKETQVKGQHRQPCKRHYTIPTVTLTADPCSLAVNAISTDPSATFSEVNRAAADPHMFLLISEGEQYIFEIAICPDVPVKTSGALPSIEDFNSHRITNEQLLKDADILQNQHLFVRFRERCFGWENGHTVLATLDLYRRALLEAQPKPASKGTWSRWWGRGQNRARTTTSDSVPTISGETQDSRSQNGQAANMDSLTVHNELTRSSTAPDLSKNPPPLLSSPSSPDLPTNAQATSADTAAVQSNSLVATMAQQKHYAKTLRLTSDQLKALNLKKGANSVSFTVQSSFSGVAVITARIFLWQSDYQIVISDIDGTITK